MLAKVFVTLGIVPYEVNGVKEDLLYASVFYDRLLLQMVYVVLWIAESEPTIYI